MNSEKRFLDFLRGHFLALVWLVELSIFPLILTGPGRPASFWHMRFTSPVYRLDFRTLRWGFNAQGWGFSAVWLLLLRGTHGKARAYPVRARFRDAFVLGAP